MFEWCKDPNVSAVNGTNALIEESEAWVVADCRRNGSVFGWEPDICSVEGRGREESEHAFEISVKIISAQFILNY